MSQCIDSATLPTPTIAGRRICILTVDKGQSSDYGESIFAWEEAA